MVEFTAHNIVLDNGVQTMPGSPLLTDHSTMKSFKRALDILYRGVDRSAISIVDLGCLEGGYAVEFARMGYQSTGIEVRESNIANCNYVKEHVNLPNLRFIRDDVRNLKAHGTYNVIFCCGLFYHLDDPAEFIRIVSEVCTDMIHLNTHFATGGGQNGKFRLSELTTHKGSKGQWFPEFPENYSVEFQERLKWCSWGNAKSFWMTKEHLLQCLMDNGFSTVFEQFDWMGKDIVESMTTGFYAQDTRTSFIGIKR